MSDLAVLHAAAYQVADEYRDGCFSETEGREWEQAWAFLVKELRRRRPGFSSREYEEALNRGFSDSR
ncbi:MAG: hypothetical protein V1816_16765 [Pseudomonadota bacterium]